MPPGALKPMSATALPGVSDVKSRTLEALLLFGLIALTAVLALLVLHIPWDEGALKTPAIDRIPTSWEVEFKELIQKHLAHDSKVMSDTTIRQGIDTLTNLLVAEIDSMPYRMDVVVVRSPAVNAVTLPGGLILVFTGLIRVTETPEELCAVLAHEMGHVYHRDAVIRLVRRLGVSVVLSLVGGDSPAVPHELIGELVDARFTREQEARADSFALELMARTGIDPVNLANFFEKLHTPGDDDNAAVVKYLRTHPHTDSRIENARRRSEHFDPEPSELPVDWDALKRALPSLFDGAMTTPAFEKLT